MLPMYLVDAFAEGPFRGNPAGVCLLESWPDDAWLSNVAMEMHQSETAFLVPAEGGFALRWFTPKVEVDLCGHATLASAAVLWHCGRADESAPIVFSTRSGELRAERIGDEIQLNFPATLPEAADPPDGLIEALGVRPSAVARSRFDYLVEVESEDDLRRAAPDFRRLLDVQTRGTIVTAVSSDPRFDFVSRFFAPSAGIDEDPATGSAHCTLAPYWKRRLGKTDFRAYQASQRGAALGVRLRGGRVELIGRAIVTLCGTLGDAVVAAAR